MKAAVVNDFAEGPRYQDFEEPTGDVVDVLAAALSPRVRSQASGSHYSSDGELPLIPGIDGIGRTASGELRYFLLPDTNRGSMAQRVAIDPRRSIRVPQNADPVQLAAAMNPVMSSWVALRRRAQLKRGQSVLILGDGNAARMAHQVAKRLGAGSVASFGRDLTGIEQVGARADIVLDYLWGEPTAEAMRAIIPARADDGQQLTWVQIGSVAGLEAPIPSAALRAVNLRIVGSGQGSVDPGDIKGELVKIAKEVARGTFELDARAVPLSEVEKVWGERTRDRIVLVP